MDRQRSILEQRIVWTRFRRQTDKDVLTAMARWFCYRGDGTCRSFTVADLAHKAGVPRRSTERALERLEADWRLEITERQRGSRRPTLYRIREDCEDKVRKPQNRFDVRVVFPDIAFGIKNRTDVEQTPQTVLRALEEFCARIRNNGKVPPKGKAK